VRELRADLWLYARIHHLPSAVLCLLGLSVADGLFGTAQLMIPSTTGVVSVPFRRELPIAFAVIAVGSLHSSMASFETTATQNLARRERVHLVAAIILAAAMIWLAEAVVTDPLRAVVYARSVVIWSGLALISGRLFGRTAAWILPVATIFPIVYYGRDNQNISRWWDWTWQPPEHMPSWMISVASVLIGYSAFTLTAWRRSRLAIRSKPQRST
jgi:hypothetical protein